MLSTSARVSMGLALCLVTCVAVFYVPFLLPPPLLHGQSAANVAGFNNKIASVAAALIGLGVLVVQTMLAGRKKTAVKSIAELDLSTVVLGISVMLCALGFLCYIIVASNTRYHADAGYFIAQIDKHEVYGKRLYTQIEFPYGPFLFYAPIWMHFVVRPLHGSATVAYCLTLLLEQVGGLLLLAYIINALKIQKSWKTLFFALCILLSVPVNAGVNYTFLRFTAPAASLVLLSRLTSITEAALWASAGEIVCLCISPEMGLSFLAGTVVFGAYKSYRIKRGWLTIALLPVVAAAVFLFLNRNGYLRMLGLFAGGVNNLIVEPVPFVLFFLIAFVWLAPRYVAHGIKRDSSEAPVTLALYVSAIALLPVGFGRTDPQHLFFNEISVYLLALASISEYKIVYQRVWATAMCCVLAWTAYVTALYPQCSVEYYDAFRATFARQSYARKAAILLTRTLHFRSAAARLRAENETSRFDFARFTQLTGNTPVNLPYAPTYDVELYMRSRGQYIPSFYIFETAVLDDDAEERQIRGLTVSPWLLLPHWCKPHAGEVPENTQWMMGISLPYHTKRTPFVLGLRIQRELERAWVPVADLGDYTLWHQAAAAALLVIPSPPRR